MYGKSVYIDMDEEQEDSILTQSEEGTERSLCLRSPSSSRRRRPN